MSDNEIESLLNECKGHTRDIVECAIHTGMRKSEILGLNWDQIKNGMIYLRKTKTDNPRQIPINFKGGYFKGRSGTFRTQDNDDDIEVRTLDTGT